MGQYLRGLRYLRAHPDVLVVALQKATMALFLSTAFQVIQVAIAQQVFTVGQGGGISLGLMFGITGVGSGLGPIAARKLTGDDPRSLKEAIAYGYLLAIAGIMVTAPLLSLPMVLLGSFVRSIGSGIIWVFSTHLLLQMAPDEVRGPRLRQRLHVLLPRQRNGLQYGRRSPRHQPHHPHHHLDPGRPQRRSDCIVDRVGDEGEARDGLSVLSKTGKLFPSRPCLRIWNWQITSLESSNG